jgi:hypothetical protein
MTNAQLARVLSNGRTKQASSSPSQSSPDAPGSAGIDAASAPKRSLLAALFGGGKDEEEDREAASAASAPTQAHRAGAAAVAAAGAKSHRRGGAAHEPNARPATADAARPAQPKTFALASAPASPARPAHVPQASGPVALSASDAIATRGFWAASPSGEPAAPPRPPAEIQTASAGPVPVSREPPGQGTEPEVTGSIAPWLARPGEAVDRVPPELALAYAAQLDPPASRLLTPRAAPMGASAERAAAAGLEPSAAEASSLTVAKKTLARLPSGKQPSRPPTSSGSAVRVAAGMRFDDPWLRAMMLAPSLQTSMTATPYGEPDYHQLRPLMLKPMTTVMMTFSDDPYPGMTTERFRGGAVVFLATVTFQRTASLE